MHYIEIILLAMGLSMDSLAVSVAGGAVIRNCSGYHLIKIAAVMGVFQAGMTAAGYMAGLSFEKYICAFDHWIAFILLFYLGARMIHEDLFRKEDKENNFNPLEAKILITLALATSIDALAVGISLAILKSPLMIQALIIGLVTFLFSAFGVYFGNRFGNKIDLRIGLIGGLILIAIGTKILLEHTVWA